MRSAVPYGSPHEPCRSSSCRSKLGVLLELHGAKRLRFNDDQRRRLAVKGSALERRALAKMALACARVSVHYLRRCQRSVTDSPARNSTTMNFTMSSKL